MSAELEVEIKETERQIANHFAQAGKLQTHLSELKRRLQDENAGQELRNSTDPSLATEVSEGTQIVGATAATRLPVVTAGPYSPIESFYWDQGQYNSPIITVYIELEKVGSVADRVEVSFTRDSFDVKVHDLDGKNFRLVKTNLEKDVVPAECKYIIKKNKIIVKLQKVKGEYSYETWQSLTGKKSRAEKEAAKKDPAGGINEMIKEMYDNGDENMKKIIGEAMLKSRSGEKPDIGAGL